MFSLFHKIFLIAILIITFSYANDSTNNKIFISEIKVAPLNQYEKKDIDNITKVYKNRELSIEDIKNLQIKLNEYFKEKGETFTKVIIPPQKIEQKVLIYQVVKAKVGDIKIEGNRHYSSEFIKSIFGFKKGEYLKYNKMVNSLTILNEFKGLNVRSFLEKGKEFASTDITLKVEDKKPFFATLMLDNQGSKDTSKYRLSLNMLYGNLIKDGDELSFTSSIGIDGRKTKYMKIDYISAPLNSLYTKFYLGYLRANYVVGGDFSILDIKGDSKYYNFGFIQPVYRTLNSKADIYFDYTKKDIKNYLLGSISSKNRIDIFSFLASYQYSGIDSALSINFSISKGINHNSGMGSRVDEAKSFLKENLTLDYQKILDEKNSFLFHLNYQHSSDKLPVNEMMCIGGLGSVRGYDSCIKTGDYGYNLSFELLRDVNMKYLKKIGLFLDYGSAHVNNPVPGESSVTKLLGGGVEFIIQKEDHFSANFAIGFPIAYKNTIDKHQKVKLYFNINYKLR